MRTVVKASSETKLAESASPSKGPGFLSLSAIIGRGAPDASNLTAAKPGGAVEEALRDHTQPYAVRVEKAVAIRMSELKEEYSKLQEREGQGTPLSAEEIAEHTRRYQALTAKGLLLKELQERGVEYVAICCPDLGTGFHGGSMH